MFFLLNFIDCTSFLLRHFDKDLFISGKLDKQGVKTELTLSPLSDAIYLTVENQDNYKEYKIKLQESKKVFEFDKDLIILNDEKKEKKQIFGVYSSLAGLDQIILMHDKKCIEYDSKSNNLKLASCNAEEKNQVFVMIYPGDEQTQEKNQDENKKDNVDNNNNNNNNNNNVTNDNVDNNNMNNSTENGLSANIQSELKIRQELDITVRKKLIDNLLLLRNRGTLVQRERIEEIIRSIIDNSPYSSINDVKNFDALCDYEHAFHDKILFDYLKNNHLIN
ncbi:hypothetical protein GVAV_003415 [Gurleya vavrai]